MTVLEGVSVSVQGLYFGLGGYQYSALAHYQVQVFTTRVHASLTGERVPFVAEPFMYYNHVNRSQCVTIPVSLAS